MKKKAIKKIGGGILLAFGLLIIFVTKNLNFNPEANERSKKYHHFFPHAYELHLWYEEKPLYVFSSKTIDEYNRSCFTQKKRCLFLPHQETIADFSRIRYVQYVGKAVSRDKSPYFIAMMEGLANLAPYRVYPYVFGELFGPLGKTSSLSKQEKTESRNDTVKLGLKWVFFTCDNNKIEKIKAIADEDFVPTVQKNDSSYQKPCASWELTHNLWFTYFYYLQNYAAAAQRYKVTAFDPTSPKIAASMPAIILWQMGMHLKSASLRFENFLILQNNLNTWDEKKIADMERTIQKAIFEYSLHLIEQAAEKAWSLCIHDFTCLETESFLSHVIGEEENLCLTSEKKDETEKMKCILLSYGKQKWFISKTSLIYPFTTPENWLVYERNEETEGRWIVRKF